MGNYATNRDRLSVRAIYTSRKEIYLWITLVATKSLYRSMADLTWKLNKSSTALLSFAKLKSHWVQLYLMDYAHRVLLHSQSIRIIDSLWLRPFIASKSYENTVRFGPGGSRFWGTTWLWVGTKRWIGQFWQNMSILERYLANKKCDMVANLKWGWQAYTTKTVCDICTFTVLFWDSRPFLSFFFVSDVFMKSTLCCVIQRARLFQLFDKNYFASFYGYHIYHHLSSPDFSSGKLQ